MIFLEIAGGIILLLVGGEMLVRGSVQAAERLGVSPLVIGLTLVGFGTSTPELVTSLEAALLEAPGIAIGNVVGSNIANILLIIGASALIAPVICARDAIVRDGTVMMVATLMLSVAVLMGELGRISGFVLVSGLAAYLVWAWSNGKKDGQAARAAAAETARSAGTLAIAEAGASKMLLPAAIGLTGLGLIIVGAGLLVRGAVELAEAAGISQTVIGLTIVAIGTSLPELVTSVVAAWRGHSALAIGNVIGSNIFNILGIAGITAAVHPIVIDAAIARFDIWVMAGASLALIAMALHRGRISRVQGGALLSAYVLYLGLLLI